MLQVSRLHCAGRLAPTCMHATSVQAPLAGRLAPACMHATSVQAPLCWEASIYMYACYKCPGLTVLGGQHLHVCMLQVSRPHCAGRPASTCMHATSVQASLCWEASIYMYACYKCPGLTVLGGQHLHVCMLQVSRPCCAGRKPSTYMYACYKCPGLTVLGG